MSKIFTVILFAAWSLFGQAVPGRYVVELADAPAALGGGSRTAVRARQAEARRAIAAHGGAVLDSMDTVVNGLIVTIPEGRAPELGMVPGVARVYPVYRVQAALDHALPLHKVPDAWALLPLGQNSAGAGMKIAIVDSGIDAHHPGFRGDLPALDGFPKVFSETDKKNTNAKVIVAKNYTLLDPTDAEPDADDRLGHGTALAMTAAGGTVVNALGPMTGVAPAAYLGNYKVLTADGGAFTDVIAKAVDDAVADGMDVINLSLGLYVTREFQVSTDNIGIAAMERAVRAGVLVTVAAGNEGPDPGTVADLGTAPNAISVAAIHNDRTLDFGVLISGAPPYQAFPGDGPDPGRAISAELFDVEQIDPSALLCTPAPAGSLTGKIALILRGTCFFEDKINNAMAGGAAAALIYNSATGSVWGVEGSPTVQLATLPAMFVNRNEGVDIKQRLGATAGLQATLDFLGVTPLPARDDVTFFSSRGPSVGAALKPDLSAAGQEVVTATQSTYPDGEFYDPSGYANLAGTSISAPMVAGAAAVLKAGRPGLSVAQYRSLLINTASSANSAPDTPAAIADAGAGKLNLGAAMTSTVAAFPTAIQFGTSKQNANPTAGLTLFNVGKAADTLTIKAIPSGSGPAPSVALDTVSLDPAASRQINVSLAGDGLAAGSYEGYLQIASAGTPSVIRVPYWFAVPGSDAAKISITHQSVVESPRSVVTRAVVFRFVDAAGLPIESSTPPKVSVVAGTLRDVYQYGDIPGTWAVDVRTGASSTLLEVDITAGSLQQSVFIFVF